MKIHIFYGYHKFLSYKSKSKTNKFRMKVRSTYNNKYLYLYIRK